ncbi:hypothetical protein ACWTV9_17160 [Clostridioides difficile]
MNDMKFIETLKQKRNVCDYSQSRLAQELQINRQNLNEIDRLFAKMYEDRACEKITERNFVMLSSKYQKELIKIHQMARYIDYYL